MVSQEVAKSALSRILSEGTTWKENEQLLESFHLIGWYSHESVIEPTLLYMCLGRENLVFVGLGALREAVTGDEEIDVPKSVDDGVPLFTTRVPYSCITVIKVHARAEDRFGLVLDDTHGEYPRHLGPVMHLSSVYRKEVVSSIQIQHDTHVLSETGVMQDLRIEFVGTDTSDPRLAFRHPAVKMFSKLPVELAKDHDGRPKKVFFRRGYMFLLPRYVVDTYELMPERPTSTYVFRPRNAARKGAVKPEARSEKAQHLLVHFLPEKPVRVDRCDSELEFELWTESVAYAVAEEQFQKNRVADDAYDPHVYHDTYFVPNHGVHHKKLNIVGDDTKWHCFRIHLRTKFREIGVIGVRRMYLPPRIDTYQDMIFIMYGELQHETDEYEVDPKFMRILDELVDSLSPASAALQSRTRNSATMAMKAPHLRSHPTFYDRLLIQSRANSLFFNRDVYAWLKFKEQLQIVPRTLFIDMQCNALAAIFCKSIFKLLPKVHSQRHGTNNDDDDTGGGGGGGGGDEDDSYDRVPDEDVVAVADPLSIIFRTQSREGSEENSGVTQADWSRRISRYFAFCVDGGWSRAHLTIPDICKVKVANQTEQNKVTGVSQDAMDTIDRVLDFLLCIVPSNMDKFVFTDNVVHKLRICEVENGEIDPDLRLNEWVMLRVLQTDYLESLISRVSKEEQLESSEGESSYLLAYLFKALLSKSHNLELIRGVCQKISGLITGQHLTEESTELAVKPLLQPLIDLVQRGNLYAKTYAMHALYAIAHSDDGELIVKDVSEPVPLCVQIMKETKYPELLQATMRFLVALYGSLVKYVDEESNPILKPDVVSMFVDMMGRRMNTLERHPPVLLEEVARMLLHLSSNERARDIMLGSHENLVGKLMELVRDHESYSGQLIVLTKCLANLFIQAKDHESMFNHGIVAENAAEYCVVLSETLSDVANKTKISVTLYVLWVLRQLIRVDIPQKLAEKSAQMFGVNDKAVRAYNRDCERRFKILQSLATTHVAFDQILKTIMNFTKRWKETKTIDHTSEVDSTNLTTAQKIAFQDLQMRNEQKKQQQRRRDVTKIVQIVRWFRDLIRDAKNQKWNYKSFSEYVKSNPNKSEDVAAG